MAACLAWARMIRQLGHRLGHVMQPRSHTPPDRPTVEAEPRSRPATFELVAFTAEARVTGYVTPSTERLTDRLNEQAGLLLTDALVVAHGADAGTVVSELVIPRAELLAVSAAGSRGDPLRRIRTRGHPMGVRLGPYLIHGHLHSRPGADPLVAMHNRGPMVPLTEARLECEWGGQRWVEGMAAVIVNRDAIDWIGEVREEDVRMPIIVPAPDYGRLTKDFTGAR